MKNQIFTLGLIISCLIGSPVLNAQEKVVLPPNFQADTRIDNMGYWRICAELGLVPVQPFTRVPAATYSGSKVFLKGVLIQDSPDVPVTTDATTTQSENSIFVDPNDRAHVLNSNNSTPNPSNGTVYGANWYHSFDEGETWAGTKQGAGTSNSGDPAACINLSGRYFVGYIDNAYGQSVSYSDDEGATWSVVKVGTGSIVNMCDKNHLWVDNSPTSPFKGNLYDGWMSSNQITVSKSNTNGTSWSTPVAISQGTSAGSHNQGENFKTGPNGEAYCVWAVYDSWPSDEKALGFSKSLDGGITWSPATRILNNIKGIRTTGVPQNMRVNSFPSMACDISNSPYRGNIYVVWPNIGVPGTNSGTDVDVYMIKSSDNGVTWSAPIRINQDPINAGKKHYFPWITCDQANGTLSVVFYDNRNVSNSQLEVFMAHSTDGGDTWADMKVSDISFTPSPIPLMATGYFGDYLSISAYNGKTYPCWTDNRLGYAMTYVSPIDLTVPKATIEYQANILNDTTLGNGNGKMDFGEQEFLGLTLKNTGNDAADSVYATLSSPDPFISISDSLEYYGDFATGQTRTIFSGFKFDVSDSIPGMQEIPFYVTTRDKNDSITVSTFTILSHGPAVSIISMTVSDPTGNNNGYLDPGETATLYIETRNTGDYDAVNVISELSSNNSYVTVITPSYSLGTLTPGQSATAIFTVSVNSAAYIGSAVKFHNYAHAQYQFDNKDFIQKIGLATEDWETGNFLKFPWQLSGDANWTIDPVVKWEKLYSAKSGTIGNSQSTDLSLTYNVLYDDSISFYRKVSSQALSDKLKFYIDGNVITQWFGNQDWKRYAYPVLQGPHTFKWEYLKDANGSAGEDAAWIDFIVLPPEYRLAATAGGNGAVCSSNSYPLHGLAANYDSLLWTTSGTGIFSDPKILNPVYTPSTQDISAGSVVLSLHAYGNNVPDTTDSMTLTIIPATTATAGSNGSICSGNAFEISDANAANYSGLQWISAGDGIFDNPTTIHPIYTPGPQDKLAGSVNLILTAVSGSACPNVSDTLLLTILPVATAQAGNDAALCAGSVQSLSGIASNYSAVHWSTTGDGSFNDPAILQPVYTPGTSDKQSGSVKLVLTAISASACPDAADTLLLTIHMVPVVTLGPDTAICSNQSIGLDATTTDATAYLWYPSGATTPKITVDSLGYGLGTHEFKVVVTNSFGCLGADSVNVTIKTCLGIEELQGVTFRLYPNPAHGILTVEINSDKPEKLNIRILSAKGDVSYSLQNVEVNGFVTRKIDLGNLSQGNYVFEISGDSGKIYRKLVIQK
jgi:hypothetical protein